MSTRFPPPKGTPQPPVVRKKGDEGSTDGNALWRIPSWFPEMLPTTLELLKAYHVELLKFNIKLNLISRNTEREADEMHFADCILASELLLKEKLGARVFDIGSGNGFPGIVLGILDAKREFVLVESDQRKCEFLKHAIHRLQMKNMSVMNVRLENLQGTIVECAISRGFASISKTLLGCNRIFGKTGSFFHLKGNNWSSEVAELPSQIISVWTPRLVGEYTLPVSQARRAIVATQKE